LTLCNICNYLQQKIVYIIEKKDGNVTVLRIRMSFLQRKKQSPLSFLQRKKGNVLY